MAYCTISEVRDKTVDEFITSAGWADDDIQARINEGAEIIDSKLISIGYSQSQLSSAPLIKRINVLYARYAILRDILARLQPSKTDERGFVAWKNEALELLDKIIMMELLLIDSSGNIIKPNSVSLTIVPVINTQDVKRIFNMTTTKDWKISEESYSNEIVIGKK